MDDKKGKSEFLKNLKTNCVLTNLSESNIKSRCFNSKLFIPLLMETVFIIAIIIITITHVEDMLIERKKVMIKELISTVHSMVVPIEQEINNQEISIDDAKKKAANLIRGLRYGSENLDYFWVIDKNHYTVVNPFSTHLEGTESSYITDKKGKHFIKEFVSVAKEKKEGFVSYEWQWKDDPTNITSKISYLKTFEPWDWIIGTGIYMEDIKAEISRIIYFIIISLIIIFVLIMLNIFYTLCIENKKKKMEDTYSQKENNYRNLVKNLPVGIFRSESSVNGKLIMWNPTLLSMFGYSVDDAKNLNLEHIFIDTKTRENFFNYLKEIKEIGKTEIKMQRKDGVIIWASVRAQVCYEDNITYFNVTLADITESVNYREQLEESCEELKNADVLKDEIISVVSHELRTPMTIIKGYTSMLIEDSYGDIQNEQKEVIVKIQNTTTRLIEMVNSMLNLSKLDSGMMKMEIEKLFLNEVIERTIHDFSIKAKEKNIKMIFQNCEKYYVDSDKSNLERVLINLLGNAIKFTDNDGLIKVIIRPYSVKNKVQIDIEDSGRGISEENLQAIFERFRQADDHLNRDYEGTGLGLPIVKSIIEYLGEKIWVNSAVGKGSIFSFTLQLTGAKAIEVEPSGGL